MPTVLITGAGGNLGRAVARHFLDLQYQLALVDHQPAALAAHFGHWPQERVALVGADLLDMSTVRRCVDQVLGRFGGIDVLCNIAGGFHMGEEVHGTPVDTWQQQHRLNVVTTLHAVQAVVPHMLRQGYGKIVNVGAFAAQRGGARMGAYVAAKAAVVRLTESMAAELREHRINVNCVLPTILDTPENRVAMPDADPARWVATDDLAAVIGFLASAAANAVHGAALPVTGLS